MKLSKKTFFYSTIISIIMVSLIVGYFILMLPSLYIDYMQNRNLKSVVAIQKGIIKEGSYDKLEVANPTSTITVKIPYTGNKIFIINTFIHATIEIKDKDFMDVLNQIRYDTKHMDKIKKIRLKGWNLAKLKKKFSIQKIIKDNYPLKLTINKMVNKNSYQLKSSKIHMISDDLFIYETNVSDGHNYYTSYIAMSIKDDTIYITMVPVMTPRMDEIKPVVLQSMPMIIAVALLLVIISSQIFSSFIVNPIIRLANHAEYMKEAKGLKLEPLKLSGNDEISALGESLNKLYGKIQESYLELEIKNKYLAEENKRQEVFLRASSHQLKTPVTAALLLVEGMMNEVGKYKNVKEYLPQVKVQLQSMQKIIEDILYLNHCSQNLQLERYSLEQIVMECLNLYHIQIEEKALQIINKGHMPEIVTDRELMSKIIDNLLSNAVNYTPDGEKIELVFSENSFRMINYGITIEEELLPHVFEAFVTSNNTIRGHGLGLYIVSYYSKLLGCQVKLSNIDHGVCTQMTF